VYNLDLVFVIIVYIHLNFLSFGSFSGGTTRKSDLYRAGRLNLDTVWPFSLFVWKLKLYFLECHV
ncbi:MAG: hypothetical protein VW518_05420, partial [Burkholderiaceae bacterium]